MSGCLVREGAQDMVAKTDMLSPPPSRPSLHPPFALFYPHPPRSCCPIKPCRRVVAILLAAPPLRLPGSETQLWSALIPGYCKCAFQPAVLSAYCQQYGAQDWALGLQSLAHFPVSRPVIVEGSSDQPCLGLLCESSLCSVLSLEL